MSETTLDRSFDQTAVHIHADGAACPSCPPQPTAQADGNPDVTRSEGQDTIHTLANVSPDYLVERIFMLQEAESQLVANNQRLFGELEAAKQLINILEDRITRYEELTESFAGRIDAMMLEIDNVSVPSRSIRNAKAA